MIFITVGTTKFPFDRLLKAVDEFLVELNCKEKVVVQLGASDYRFKYKNVKVFKEISFKNMLFYIKKAKYVICHAGPATIFLCWQEKKTPIIMPRLKKFKEHVDNHQLYFADYLYKNRRSPVIFDKKDLKKESKRYLGRKSSADSFYINDNGRKQLVKKLVNFTNGL